MRNGAVGAPRSDVEGVGNRIFLLNKISWTKINSQFPSKQATAQMKPVKNQDELCSTYLAHVPLLTPYPPGPGAAAGWALQEPPPPQRCT